MILHKTLKKKKAAQEKKAKKCHKWICNTSCSGAVCDYDLQMTALYWASKPPFSVVFCNLLGLLEVRQTFVVKTFLLLQGKLLLMPSQSCLPFVTPIGGWAPSQSPVLPYSTEHPPLSLCCNGLHNTSDPSATATENCGPTHEPRF